MNDRAALVDKVAMAMWEANHYDASQALARIAIDLIRAETLEEAARVADEKENEWTLQWRAGLKVDSHLEGKSSGACEIAAAIRALRDAT